MDLSPRGAGCLLAVTPLPRRDFLTLFHSYVEYGTTTVLRAGRQHGDVLAAETRAADAGRAQTVVYAAMCGGGEYQGAIAYVVCGGKRYWTPQNRRGLGGEMLKDRQRLPEQASGRERRDAA